MNLSKYLEAFNPDLLWESVKEPLRLLFLGLVSWAITYISGLEATTWTPVLLLVLRMVDSLLHEVGKVTKDESMEKGLTRF